MAWMTAEAAVAVTAGVLASSIALTGFGLDSVIEFFAAAIVVWQLRGEEEGQERETRAVRLIGVTFFALALYLAVEAIRDLATQARPGQSAAGLAVAGAALVVMPALAVAKLRTGRALGNRTLTADSAETAFCAFTSAAATLLGVGLQLLAGLVAGRPRRGPGHRRACRHGRLRSLGRRHRRLTNGSSPGTDLASVASLPSSGQIDRPRDMFGASLHVIPHDSRPQKLRKSSD